MFAVCTVRTPDGTRNYLTVLPAEDFQARGLIREAIVGVVADEALEGQGLRPEHLVPNPVFVQFLHEMIERFVPLEPACVEEAKRIGKGWISVVDGRTNVTTGEVPSADLIGMFEVTEGEVGAYEPNPGHALVTEDGLFQLAPGVQVNMLSELRARLPS